MLIYIDYFSDMLTRTILPFLLLLSLLSSCEDVGPEPIDMPDPTDTMTVDTMPMDTIPMDTMPDPIDTMDIDIQTNVWLDKTLGTYKGYCHLHYTQSMDPFIVYDTLDDFTIVIDSVRSSGRYSIHQKGNGDYELYYALNQDPYTIAKTAFEQDTFHFFAFLYFSQQYPVEFTFIRSQEYLYYYKGHFPFQAFSTQKCYCYKQ